MCRESSKVALAKKSIRMKISVLLIILTSSTSAHAIANEAAKRYTAGHFDLPMRNCTIRLDDTVIVDGGVLQGDLA